MGSQISAPLSFPDNALDTGALFEYISRTLWYTRKTVELEKKLNLDKLIG